jgi:hypothetical protein
MSKIIKINPLNLSFFIGFFILTNLTCHNSSAQENDADFEKEFSKFENEINKGSIHDPFENFNRKVYKFNDTIAVGPWAEYSRYENGNNQGSITSNLLSVGLNLSLNL